MDVVVMDIAIFYHVGQLGNWQEIYQEQIERLTASGILDTCKYFHIGVNGTSPLPLVPENAHVSFNNNHVLEADTLTSLWHFARDNPHYKTLYLHTKGVTRINTEYEQNTKEWRHYLEYFCVDKWRACVDTLESHDTCGVLLRKKAVYGSDMSCLTPISANFYDGNFWWANASYIATLDPMYMYIKDIPWLRGKSELWVGTGNPKSACLHMIDYITPYDTGTFSKEKYIMESIIDIIHRLDINNLDDGRGTDKISNHSYDLIYGPTLERFRDKQGSLLEIGMWNGGSAMVWRHLLPKFALELVDNDLSKFHKEHLRFLYNTRFLESDAYTESVVDHYKNQYPDGLDVIIEDGPHTLETQLFAVTRYSELLKSEGILIVEDIYPPENLQVLIDAVPDGFEWKEYDLRHVKGRYDDIALVITRKNTYA